MPSKSNVTARRLRKFNDHLLEFRSALTYGPPRSAPKSKSISLFSSKFGGDRRGNALSLVKFQETATEFLNWSGPAKRDSE